MAALLERSFAAENILKQQVQWQPLDFQLLMQLLRLQQQQYSFASRCSNSSSVSSSSSSDS
jgi:hypothetical protein